MRHEWFHQPLCPPPPTESPIIMLFIIQDEESKEDEENEEDEEDEEDEGHEGHEEMYPSPIIIF